MHPENPSNINFEFLEVNSFDHYFRTFVVSIISTLMIMISFSITAIIAGIIYKEDPNCSKQMSFSQYTQALEDFPGDSENLTECYCFQLPYSEMLAPENKKACPNNLRNLIFFSFMSFVASSVAYLCNYSIQYFLKKLIRFQRFKSYTKEINSMLNRQFIPVLSNTALVTPLIYSNIRGFEPGSVILKLVRNSQSLETYNTIDSSWFEQVGLAMTFILSFNMIAPVIGLIQKKLRLCIKKILLQKKKTKVKIWKGLLPSPFAFHYRYAYGLMTVGVCLLYEPLMPYATFFGAISLWVSVYINKVNFE